MAIRVEIYKKKADALALRHAIQRANRLALRVERAAKARILAQTYDTGRLYRSIGFKLVVRQLKVKVTLGSDQRHALVVHEGAKPHVITARLKGGMKFYWPAGVGNPPLKVGRVVCFKGRVHHPGMRGNRYLVIPLRQEAPALGFRTVASFGTSRFAR